MTLPVPSWALASVAGSGPVATLLDIALLFAAAVFIIVLFHYLRIHYVVGYLLTGILIGPAGFNLIGNMGNVDAFAEIGVILLLFTIGLEFSFSNLRRIQRYVLGGGGFQFGLTFALAVLLTRAIGSPWSESLTWGFLIAPSSTAIVVKLLQDRVLLTTEAGKGAFAILLFQDIMVVPIMLAIPILAGQGGDPLPALGLLLLKVLGIAAVAVVLAKYVVPFVFRQVMKVHSQEVFLLATISIGLGVTLLTEALGLSLALGAFIAGLLIAETDYNRLAISCVLPFRYVFISFFFLSLGMLFRPAILIEEPLSVLFWLVMNLGMKLLAATAAMLFLGARKATALKTGFYVAQIGEFSFIIAGQSLQFGLIPEVSYHVFLAVVVITMALTPYLIDWAQHIDRYLKHKQPEPKPHGNG